MFESHTWTSNSTNGEGINGYIMKALVLQKTVMELFRVAEVVRGHGGPPLKSLNLDENFKPEHTLFCCELRFVAICALFGGLWAKKVPSWFKNSVSWARSALLHAIIY